MGRDQNIRDKIKDMLRKYNSFTVHKYEFEILRYLL